MYKLTVEQLLEATGGQLIAGEHTRGTERSYSVSTDTRTLQAGQCFLALVGETFDGHTFIPQALQLPDVAVIGQREKLERLGLHQDTDKVMVGVGETLRALGDIAAWRRARLSIPVVGLTGSAGKTSTKDLIRGILETTGEGLATQGNLNNLIGLPQMVLRIADHHTWAVLEMGMNAFGEIERMATIARPTVRLITNIAHAHTEGVGGIDGVQKAKGELFATAQPGDTLVVNLDDARVKAISRPAGVKVLTYGTHPEADVRLDSVQQREDGTFNIRVNVSSGVSREAFSAHVPLLGAHNALNATAAWAVGVALGVAPERCVEGLLRVKLSPMRMEPSLLPGGILTINDAYNANPSSMEAALKALADLRKPGGRTIAALGDMLELGALELTAHHKLGARAVETGVDLLFCCGLRSRMTLLGARSAGLPEGHGFHSLDHAEVGQRLAALLQPGDVLLLKGSRGARMEKVLLALQQALGVTGGSFAH